MIEKRYAEKGRHYHTLKHLDHIIAELQPCRESIVNWEAVVLATAYHDIIYNVLRQDNEEKSASFAVKELASMGWDEQMQEACRRLILATCKHEFADSDTNFFTDADLSILGSDPESYRMYTEQVRKEYAIFPNIIYKPGRRKVLVHFLGMTNIFKTSFFAGKYEATARANLERELTSL